MLSALNVVTGTGNCIFCEKLLSVTPEQQQWKPYLENRENLEELQS
jgi:hypothetical protein